jgi:hypothetical protein
MALITTGLAVPVMMSARRWEGGSRMIRLATGSVSVAMGVWLVYQIGWSDGFFLTTPAWTPR